MKHRTRDCQTETGNSGTQTDKTQETEGGEMGPMTGEMGNQTNIKTRLT